MQDDDDCGPVVSLLVSSRLAAQAKYCALQRLERQNPGLRRWVFGAALMTVALVLAWVMGGGR